MGTDGCVSGTGAPTFSGVVIFLIITGNEIFDSDDFIWKRWDRSLHRSQQTGIHLAGHSLPEEILIHKADHWLFQQVYVCTLADHFW